MPEAMRFVQFRGADEREVCFEHSATGSGEVHVLMWEVGTTATIRTIVLPDADRRRLAEFLATVPDRPNQSEEKW